VIEEKLKEVNDPELGVSIIDLGLVYDIKVRGHKVAVTMGLTSPFCPLGPAIVKNVEDALIEISGIDDVKVDITLDPPWSKGRMSQKAKEELGVI